MREIKLDWPKWFCIKMNLQAPSPFIIAMYTLICLIRLIEFSQWVPPISKMWGVIVWTKTSIKAYAMHIPLWCIKTLCLFDNFTDVAPWMKKFWTIFFYLRKQNFWSRGTFSFDRIFASQLVDFLLISKMC